MMIGVNGERVSHYFSAEMEGEEEGEVDTQPVERGNTWEGEEGEEEEGGGGRGRGIGGGGSGHTACGNTWEEGEEGEEEVEEGEEEGEEGGEGGRVV